MANQTIAVITDFGSKSHYPGIMKGVIHTICPDSTVIDITHDIQPFNILQAMYVLENSLEYFPSPTIFLCVVDPGVGSERRPIIAVGERHYYVCPDNGIISKVISSDEIDRVIEINEDHYFLDRQCETFHGRDVFAPSAAWLAKYLDANRFGDEIEDYVTRDLPKIKIVADRTLKLQVLFKDPFGNLVTQFERDFMTRARERFPGQTVKLKVNETLINGIRQHYSDGVEVGDPVAYFGSMDLLEIGVREGNAAEKLNVQPGDSITVYLGE